MAAESGKCGGDAAESGFPIIGSAHYRRRSTGVQVLVAAN